MNEFIIGIIVAISSFIFMRGYIPKPVSKFVQNNMRKGFGIFLEILIWLASFSVGLMSQSEGALAMALGISIGLSLSLKISNYIWRHSQKEVLS